MNKKQKTTIKVWLAISFIVSLIISIIAYLSHVETVHDKYAFIGPTIILFFVNLIYIIILLGIPALILYIIWRDKNKQ